MEVDIEARRDRVAKEEAQVQASALRVGRANDPAETRADQFADVVVASLRSPWLATETTEHSGRIRRSAAAAVGTRQETTPRVRRAATRDALGGTAVDQATAKAIASVSGGETVPEPVRRSAEEASGHDLGAVRIHQGAQPAELSASLQATAFTVGRNVFLGHDAARPGTPAGNRLLAHELGHVVDEGAGSTVGRVRRLASGAALRAELGGPSSHSKTYRGLLDALDAYEGLLNRPLRTAGDTDGLLNDAKGLEGLARRVIQSCDAFLAGHKKDKRASRVSAVKTEATSEQAALRLRTAEVKRGVKPTWASWKDAVQSTSETTTRDIAAEKGFGVGGDKGAMNDVTKVSFKTRIGERGKPTADAFFKADKNSVGHLEGSYAEGIGVPRGADFEYYGSAKDYDENHEFDSRGPRFAQRAVAMSRIDKLLNANVISKTQLAVRNTRDGPTKGQLMDTAKGQTAASFRWDLQDGNAPGSDLDDPNLQRLMSKLDLVDSLCGQIDRHHGNVFVDRDKRTGKVTSVTGIDNDMAFGTKNFTPGQTTSDTVAYAGIGRFIDSETGEAILKITRKDLEVLLADLLLPDEIEETVRRLEVTQAVIRTAKQEGRLIGPAQWGADTAGQGAVQNGGSRLNTGYHANIFHNAHLDE